MIMLLRTGLALAILSFGPRGAAQPPTPTPSPAIDAANVTELHPVLRIDFADLPETVRVETGWFVMSDTHLAAVRRDGGLVIWSLDDGALTATYTLDTPDDTPAIVLDAQFSPDGRALASVHTADGQRYTVAVHTLATGVTQTLDVPRTVGRPVRVWLDADASAPAVWLEAFAEDDLDAGYRVARLSLTQPDAPPTLLPSGPEHDPDSVVRIGRIPAPLAITATEGGLVRLWDLQTGAVTEVALGALPVFGRVNETTGRQLAWRDQESQALHLLDFDTGANRVVADIGQAYIQALLLTPAADVILAVHIGDEAIVAAWDTATGARHDLGAYRADCTRVPDMVQLSRDGATLAIGCAVGIEVWRVE